MVDPLHFILTRRLVFWVLLCSGNIYIWKSTGDYWASGVEENPLLHTWSLAVEEQFYLLYPAVAVILLKWKPRSLFPILGTLATLSFVCSVVGTNFNPAATFYLLPTRAWELLAGCLLATCPPSIARKFANHRSAGFLAGVGLAMIGISYLAVEGGDGFPGYIATLPTIGAVIVIACTSGTVGIVARLLQHPWVVFIGRASYSLYLWHWPVIVFFKGAEEHPIYSGWLPVEGVSALILVVTIALALASYTLIECPLRVWRGTPSLCGLVFFAMLATMRLVKPVTNESKHGTSELSKGFAPITVKGRMFSVSQRNALSPAVQEKYRNVRFLLPEKAPKLDEGVIRAYGNGSTDVIVLGDSHSVMFAPLVDDILRECKISGRFFCADAISPVLFRNSYSANQNFGNTDDCRMYDDARKSILETVRPKVVLWIQRYDAGFDFLETQKSIQYILDRSTCVFFQQAPVLNIGDFCTVDVFGYFKNVKRIPMEDLNVFEKKQARVQRDLFEKKILSVFQGNKNFKWFETNKELLTPDNKIRWWDGIDKLYYLDDDHLSEYGVELFRARLQEIIISSVAIQPSKH